MGLLVKPKPAELAPVWEYHVFETYLDGHPLLAHVSVLVQRSIVQLYNSVIHETIPISHYMRIKRIIEQQIRRSCAYIYIIYASPSLFLIFANKRVL